MNEQYRNQHGDELAWDALRYVAAEMSADEADTFEARLADEQAAREAVAEAVELTQATTVALATQADLVAAGSQGTARWWYGLAVGIAACLAVMFVVQQVNQGKPSTAIHDSHADDAAANSGNKSGLAARWTEVRQQQGDFSPWDDTSVDETASSNSSNDWMAVAEDGGMHATAESALSAPEWMMAAVSMAEPGQDDMADEMDLERSVDGPQQQ